MLYITTINVPVKPVWGKHLSNADIGKMLKLAKALMHCYINEMYLPNGLYIFMSFLFETFQGYNTLK